MELKFKEGYDYVKRMIEDFFDSDLDWTLHDAPLETDALVFRPYVSIDFENPDKYFLITYCDDSPRAKSLFGIGHHRGHGYASVFTATPKLQMRIDAEACEVRPTRRAQFAKPETQKAFEAMFSASSIEEALEQVVEQIDDAAEEGKVLETVSLWLVPSLDDEFHSKAEATFTLPVDEFVILES